ncbi:response regulator transcription factor [Calditerrivibrio sp.]|uniref:response regulator transcription factor n=1 Tax=Calditerrivibrio sp. TaxID=2792612 RepID=UPI003D0AD773
MACKFLIIDDDYEILDMLKILLEVEGYEVDTASNGFTGLEKLNKNSYDLILLDLNLPDIAGEQVCKVIRKNSELPILILSAKESVTNKVLCLEYGADDYITKPFQNIELIARIKAILRRCACNLGTDEENTNILCYKNFIIDIENMIVKRDDEVINFTPKEFEIFLYLVKNKGKIVSRDKMIKELWGKDNLYKWSRSIDVHIQHIRQKIEKSSKGHLYLKTVSGVGYKLEE